MSIRHLKELQGIRRGRGGLTIGAATLLADIVESAAVQQQAPLLAMAAGKVGTPQIRNMGDDRRQPLPAARAAGITGTTIRASSTAATRASRRPARTTTTPSSRAARRSSCIPSDTAPALVALGATVRIATGGRERTVPIEKFFVTPRQDPDAREHPAAERDPRGDRGAERAGRVEGHLRQGNGA